MSLTSDQMVVTLDINIGTTRPAGKSESYAIAPSGSFDALSKDTALTLAKLRQNTLPGDCHIVSCRLKQQQIQRYEHEILPSPLIGKFLPATVGFTASDKISYTSTSGVLTFLGSEMLLVDNPDNAWFFRAQSATGHKRWLHFNAICDLFQADFAALTPTDPETWTTPDAPVAPGDSPVIHNSYVMNFKRLLKYINDYVLLSRLQSGTGISAQYDQVPIDEVLFKYASTSECGKPFQLLAGKA